MGYEKKVRFKGREEEKRKYLQVLRKGQEEKVRFKGRERKKREEN